MTPSSVTPTWPMVRLSEVCRFLSGGTPAKSKREFWGGDVPWVTPKDMKSRTLADAAIRITRLAVDESSTTVAPAGSVLVLVRGMGLARGLPVCELTRDCAFNQDIRALVPSDSRRSDYLAWAIRAAAPVVLHQRETVTHGTLKLDSSLLTNLPIPKPPPNVQERIASGLTTEFATADAARQAARDRLAAAEALPTAYLREVFEHPAADGWVEVELGSVADLLP